MRRRKMVTEARNCAQSAGSNSTDVTRQVQLWELVHQSDQYQ